MRKKYVKRNIIRQEYVSTHEMAYYVGVSPKTVRRWIIDGKVFAMISDTINGFGKFNYMIPIRELIRVNVSRMGYKKK